MSGPTVVLVNESSATRGRPGKYQADHVHALDRSHFDMVKFSRHDQGYNTVLSFFIEFTDSALNVVKKRFKQAYGEDITISYVCVCLTAS
jgi:hypothetical protein